MTNRRWLLFPMALLAASGCTAWLGACSRLWGCVAVGPGPGSWWSLPAILLILLAGSLLSWAGRTIWLLQRTANEIRRLPRCGRPASLQQAVGRTGVQRGECIEDDTPMAFCIGALRPVILISHGLLSRLRAEELDAVLLHEEHHRRRRDPLRRAARQAASDVCFYLPVLRWWADRGLETSELEADRAALRRTGPGPLAGALCVMGGAARPEGVAAFDGAAQLRAAQLLGEPLPVRRPGADVWAASGTGLLLAAGLSWCLTQMLVGF